MTAFRSISLPADTQYLARLRAFITTVEAAEHLPPKELHALELAADEVVTNVIDHAATTGEIICTCYFELDSHSIVCEISWLSDQPFVPEVFPDTDHIRQRLEAREPGGLGVFLIHTLVDEIDYDYHDGRSHVRLLKKI
ncbi:MAG: ATP-binding protein [bacterium]